MRVAVDPFALLRQAAVRVEPGEGPVENASAELELFALGAGRVEARHRAVEVARERGLDRGEE